MMSAGVTTDRPAPSRPDGLTMSCAEPHGTREKTKRPCSSLVTLIGSAAHFSSISRRCAGASQPSTRTVPSVFPSIRIMMVRVSLSKVIVRLCSVPRAATASSSCSAVSRATSISRSRKARKKRIRSGSSAGIGSAAANMSRISPSSPKSESSSGSSADGRSASGSVTPGTPGLVGQQRAQLGQAAAAGGADAPDRHAQRGGHRGVVGTRREGDDPQQFLAARGEPADGGPQQPPLVVDDDLLLRAGSGGGQLVERLVVRGDLPASGGADPPGFPAGGGDQPAGERRGVVDAVQVGDQAQPYRLQHVLGVARAQPGRARDLPEQRAELGHDLAEGVLAALPGRTKQPGDARAAVQPVLLDAASHDGSVVHRAQPGQPMLVRAVSARTVVVCASQGSSTRPDAGSAGPASRALTTCAASSGAENEVPLQTAQPRA